MADNKQAGLAVGSGPTFATDEIAGIDYPRTKVVWGVDGTATDASASNPLPVVQTGTPSLPTGASTAAKQPALGTAGASSSDVISVQGIGGGTALPVSGTFYQATQPVSAASLPLPSGAASAANQSTEITALQAIQTALGGTLTVTGGGGGTEYTEDAAAAANPVGTALILVREDARAGGLTSTDGDNVAQRGNNKGEAYVKDTDAGVSLASIDGKITAVNTGAVVVSSSALPTGAATSAKQPALGTAGTSSTDVLSVQGIASGTAMPVSVASIPSHAVTNAGTFATQVDGAALTALQLIDNLVLTEDAAHASGDPGVLALAVRRDANTTLVSTDGDNSPLQVDASGSLKVAIISGAGSGGTAMADDAAFTPATTSITPVGGTYRSTLDAVDDGDAGAFAMTANRAVHVNLRNASGAELTAGAQYAEDAVHASGDMVTMAGVVRKDTATQLAGTDGDNSVLVNDASGRLHVNVGALPAIPTGSNVIGALTANQSVNVAQINGVTALMGNGTTGTGSQRVTIASDNTAFSVNATAVGQAAHGAAIAGNPVRAGLRGMSADYTAEATGDTVDALGSLLGKQVILTDALPANTWNYAAAAGGLVNTTGVTAKAAAGAGIRNYVSKAQIMNSHQTIGSEIVIRDGAAGTVLWRGWAQFTGGGAEVEFKPPLRGAANTLIEIAEVTATGTAGVLVNLQGFVAAE